MTPDLNNLFTTIFLAVLSANLITYFIKYISYKIKEIMLNNEIRKHLNEQEKMHFAEVKEQKKYFNNDE